MTKPVILTGLRANNDLTIGNYFGGIRPMIDMATQHAGEYQLNMFIPDLHSFTTPIDHSELYEQTLRNARVFVAAGLPLNNPNIFLYRQSFVPAHSELTWILDCFTGMGEMRRMTQFKEKSTQIDSSRKHEISEEWSKIAANNWKKEFSTELVDTKQVSVGLFNYPVLMAADILLYGAKYIPVGDDQTQHLEFTRDIAERMNSRFGELFTVPEPVAKQHEFFGKNEGLRIKDLVDPTKKMSKSDESGRGVIFLTDTPDAARKKVMSATTDDKANVAYNPTDQPGISNLLELLALLQNRSRDEVVAQYEGMERYGDFKKIVADEVATFLETFQGNLANVSDSDVLAALERSETEMNKQANAQLLRAQIAVGLRRA